MDRMDRDATTEGRQMLTTDTDTRRFFAHCSLCKKRFVLNLAPISERRDVNDTAAHNKANRVHREECPRIQARIANGYHESLVRDVVSVTRVKYALTSHPTKCDGRCEAAKGPNCDCQCGGKNHGRHS